MEPKFKPETPSKLPDAMQILRASQSSSRQGATMNKTTILLLSMLIWEYITLVFQGVFT